MDVVWAEIGVAYIGVFAIIKGWQAFRSVVF